MANWREILLAILGLFGFSLDAESKPAPEPTFGGVPLSELNKVAQSIPRVLGVTIEGDSLYFRYKANSGHTTRRATIKIDNSGKLYVFFDANYPGQRYHSSVEFVNKANELFVFYA